jgi:hypothetical protein
MEHNLFTILIITVHGLKTNDPKFIFLVIYYCLKCFKEFQIEIFEPLFFETR